MATCVIQRAVIIVATVNVSRTANACLVVKPINLVQCARPSVLQYATQQRSAAGVTTWDNVWRNASKVTQEKTVRRVCVEVLMFSAFRDKQF